MRIYSCVGARAASPHCGQAGCAPKCLRLIAPSLVLNEAGLQKDSNFFARPHFLMTNCRRTLLSVDLGLRSGIALFDSEGVLLRYRSTNFGSRSRLKKAVYKLIRDAGPPKLLVLEGSRDLATIWRRAAEKQGVEVLEVAPETWRRELLEPRQRRSGQDAKEAADALAREIIDECGADAPTSLRHDAAEAIAIGYWALPRLQKSS